MPQPASPMRRILTRGSERDRPRPALESSIVGYGRVIAGDYLDASVSTRGSALGVQAGFKFRKLTPENFAEWDEVVPDGKGNAVSTVGKAVARAALPGRLGKMASAAAGATIDSIG